MDLKDVSYIYVDKYDKLEQALGILKNCRIIGVDTETTGLDPVNNKIRLLQIASAENPVLVIDMYSLSETSFE